MAQGPARATRSAKKALSEQKNEGEIQSQSQPQAAELQSALLQVNQMLALLDLPLAQSQQSKQPSSMHDGVVYSLKDLLVPLNSLLQNSGSTAQNLAAAIEAQTGSNNPPSESLNTYVSNATCIMNVLDRLNRSLEEPLPGISNGQTALQIVERHLEAEPLSSADERDVLLRMRRKRRRVYGSDNMLKNYGASSEEYSDSNTRSPLYPIPDTLTFVGLTPWIDECAEAQQGKSTRENLDALVVSFNAQIFEHCRAEAAALTSANPDHGQHLPSHRVRAHLVDWNDTAGEMQVELRDVALVSIGLQAVEGVPRIARITLWAPSERRDDQRRGVSGSLIPSRFASYNELGDHLLIYALERQRNTNYLRALGQTLEHVAAFRTFFDPLPVLETQVQTVPTRVSYTTLPCEKAMDNAQGVVWKWCRALLPSGAAAQGEWCAYSPHLL